MTDYTLYKVFMCDGSRYKLSFLSTVDASLVGVGLYGGREAGSSHDVTIAMSNEDEKLSTTIMTMTSDGGQDPIKIEVPSVRIHAYTWYSVSYSLKGPITWRGRSEKDTYDVGEFGKITF